jgi:beta-glucanase (GH16 family)
MGMKPGTLTAIALIGCMGCSPSTIEGEPLRDTDTDTDADTDPVLDSGVRDTGDTGDLEPEVPVNLLLNPGFEDGEEPWSIWGGAQLVEGQAQDGLWALKATNQNGSEQLVEGLEPNTTYRLSGWARTEGEQPMTIGVKKHGNDEAHLAFSESEYTEDSLDFTTGFGSTSAVIYAYKHSGDEAGYADNLSLTWESEGELSLAWFDEFDGEGALDSSKWGFEEGFVRNEELQWYQSDNAFQQEGTLVIEGREEDTPNPGYIEGSSDWRTSRENIDYTSSSVTTEGLFEWQYGHLVVRAKVTNLTGTWPAIWTLGTDCDWPSNGEVDIMENYGGGILANFAWGTDVAWTPEWDATTWPVSDFEEGWTEDFHIWELAWDASGMAIYLDGVELNSVDLSQTINGSAACEGQNPFQQPHYLLLNLALGGAGGGVDDLEFPTRYVVDYVRVYQ